MSSILFEVKDGTATITLNRPDKFNSFNREMALSLQKRLDECHADDAIRVVVITGNGRAFCAGQDLGEVTNPGANPGFKKILEEHYNPIIMKMRNLPKPILTAVNGVAAGAGANIALAGDIVVAHEKVSFIQAFSGIGLVPDSGGTYILPRLVGFQKALALAMLGDKISATEAEQMGMIYKTVTVETFEATVQQLAARLAQMPTRGLALTKQLFNEGMHNDLASQLALEGKYQIEAAQTADYAEGVAAFMQKRKPVFKGK